MMQRPTGECPIRPLGLPAVDVQRYARGFLVLSARRGSAQALLDLGRMHQAGQGVEANNRRALGYYRRAAAGGNAEGFYRMGLLLSEKSESLLDAWSAFLQGARLRHAPCVQALQKMTDRLCTTRQAVSPACAILSSR